METAYSTNELPGLGRRVSSASAFGSTMAIPVLERGSSTWDIRLASDDTNSKLTHCPLPNDSPFRTFWDVLISFALIYVSISLPFFMGFFTVAPPVVKYIDFFIDILFYIDIILNFLTDFENKEGKRITSFTDIALNYLKSWFFIDLISSLPFDIMFKKARFARMSKVAKILRALKFIKMARLSKIGRLAPKLQSEFDIKNATISLVKFLLLIFYAGHWFGCFFFILSKHADFDPQSWTMVYLEGLPDGLGPLAHRNWQTQYLTSVYWSITIMSTIGFGDIMPGSGIERAFVTVCQLIGAIIFAYGISRMCTLVLNLDREAAYFHGLQDGIKGILTKRKITARLRKEIKLYLLHKYYRSSIEIFDKYDEVGNQVSEKEKLLNLMSGSLKTDVNREFMTFQFRNVRPLTNYGEHFMACVGCLMEGQLYGNNELIFQEGTNIDKIFFPVNGSVDLIFMPKFEEQRRGSMDLFAVRANSILIGEGYSFNACASILNQRTTMSAFSTTFVDIYSLPAHRYRNVLQELFPEHFKKLLCKLKHIPSSHKKEEFRRLLKQLEELEYNKSIDVKEKGKEKSIILKLLARQIDISLPKHKNEVDGTPRRVEIIPRTITYRDHNRTNTNDYQGKEDVRFHPNHIRWKYLREALCFNVAEEKKQHVDKHVTFLPCPNSEIEQLEKDIQDVHQKIEYLVQSFEKHNNLIIELHHIFDVDLP